LVRQDAGVGGCCDLAAERGEVEIVGYLDGDLVDRPAAGGVEGVDRRDVPAVGRR
jgi:hypothetical protein